MSWEREEQSLENGQKHRPDTLESCDFVEGSSLELKEICPSLTGA